MKKMLAFLLVFTLSSNSILAFADETNVSKSIADDKSSSYTYTYLGEAVSTGSVEGVKRSASLIAAAIAGMISCSPEFAYDVGSTTHDLADLLWQDEAFYEFHTHTTEVRLDGEFSHYIIKEEVYIFADEDFTEQVGYVEHTGESLTPMDISEDKVLSLF